MKKIAVAILLSLSLNANTQENVVVELPETYELANIILALTTYGRTDPWDVQKISPYYDKVLQYFEPVKQHPLLDSVNYSRAKWEQFLGFRTDAYAFSFNESGQLKRAYPFNSFGTLEFDKNIDLINDFVVQSNYRAFYRDHQDFYSRILSNYKEYYLLEKSKAFLDTRIGKPPVAARNVHKIVISPLVGGQNCHRAIDSVTSADFPNISKELILGGSMEDLKARLVANHSLFTEMDHGYVNPVSDQYAPQIMQHFNPQIWYKQEGYPGINSFNEYMTWAVYDWFLKEHFPQYADSIALQWHYQNASRGFIASELFARKLLALAAKNKGRKLESLYRPLLRWCKEVENQISQPTFKDGKANEFVSLRNNRVQVAFSEKMEKAAAVGALLVELKDGKQTGKTEPLVISQKQNKLLWSPEGDELSFELNTGFQEFAVLFNWWGIDKPLRSKNGILLKPQSYLLLKK